MTSQYDANRAGRRLSIAGEGAALLDGLPEWNLADLYSGMDAPELARDLERAATDAAAFEARWKGRLADETANAAAGGLGNAVLEYEALEDLLGRIGSYAGLLYAGDTSDPARAKLYGDVQ
jgi:oligoendopeptidase F